MKKRQERTIFQKNQKWKYQMNEIRIKLSTVYRELIIFGVMFAVFFFTNVYAVVSYNGQWLELLTQLHIVGFLSLVFYFLLALIRIIVFGVKTLVRKTSGEEAV